MLYVTYGGLPYGAAPFIGIVPVFFTGDGALSSVAVVGYSGSQSASGTGSLSTSVVPGPIQTSGFGGSGVLTSTQAFNINAAGPLSGSGVLSSVATVTASGSGSLAGSGALSSVALLAFSASVPVTGSGSLTGSGAPDFPAAVGFSGAGTVTVVGAPGFPANEGGTGSGTLSGTGTPSVAQTSPLAGSGTISSVSGVVNINATRALSGTGSLSTSGVTITVLGTGTTSGTGSLTVVASLFVSATYNPSGTGSLTSTQIPSVAVTSPFTGTGALSSAPAVSISVSSALSGSGSLSSAAILAFSTTRSYSGTGTLSTTAVPNPAQSVSFAGTGTPSVTFAPGVPASRSFAGDGILSVVDIINPIASPSIVGVGDMSAEGDIILDSSFGIGRLRVAFFATFTALYGGGSTGTLDAFGVLNAISVPVLNGGGDLSTVRLANPIARPQLTGSGQLSGVGVQQHAGSGSLTGTGSLTGPPIVAFSRSASLGGSGSLTGSAAFVITSVFAGTATGVLSSSPTFETASANAQLGGSGTLNRRAVYNQPGFTYDEPGASYNDGESAVRVGFAVPVALGGEGVFGPHPDPLHVITIYATGQLTAEVVDSFAFVVDGQTANGTLSGAQQFATATGSAAFAGDGLQTPNLSFGSNAIVFLLDGSGSLSAVSEDMSAANTETYLFNGDGQISVFAARGITGASSFSGSGKLTSVRSFSYIRSVNYAGIGALRAIGSVILGDGSLLAQFSSTGHLGHYETSSIVPIHRFGYGALTAAGAVTSADVHTSGLGTLGVHVNAVAGLGFDATLTGSGGLLAAPQRIRFPHGAALSRTGSGSLTTVRRPALDRTRNGSGVGTLTKTVQSVSYDGGYSFRTGSGSLSVAVVAGFSHPVPLTGSGALRSSVVLGFARARSLTGSGALSVTADLVRVTAIISSVLYNQPGWVYNEPGASYLPAATHGFTSRGSLSVVAGSPAPRVEPALAGSGGLSATAHLTAVCTHAFGASGSLSAVLALHTAAGVSRSAAGALVAAGHDSTPPPEFGEGILDGQGHLGAFCSLKPDVIVPLPGTGTLSAALVVRFAGAVSLTSPGTLHGTRQRITTSRTAPLSGSGALTVVGKTRVTKTAPLIGTGSLSRSVVSITVILTKPLTAVGALSAVTRLTTSRTAALGGSGGLFARGLQTWVEVAELEASGSLAALGVPRVYGPVSRSAYMIDDTKSLLGTRLSQDSLARFAVSETATMTDDGRFGVPAS